MPLPCNHDGSLRAMEHERLRRVRPIEGPNRPSLGRANHGDPSQLIAATLAGVGRGLLNAARGSAALDQVQEVAGLVERVADSKRHTV